MERGEKLMKAIDFLKLPLVDDIRQDFGNSNSNYDAYPYILLDEGLCENSLFAFVGKDANDRWYICWPLQEEEIEATIDQCVEDICNELKYNGFVEPVENLPEIVKNLIQETDIVDYWK